MKNIHILNGHGQGGAPDPHGPPVIVRAAWNDTMVTVGKATKLEVFQGAP
jgi:hypothetical protein